MNTYNPLSHFIDEMLWLFGPDKSGNWTGIWTIVLLIIAWGSRKCFKGFFKALWGGIVIIITMIILQRISPILCYIFVAIGLLKFFSMNKS